MSTDDQSTPTPMAVERRHVLMPAAALADLLGAGFYLPTTAGILDSYGGWTTGAKQQADSLPERIHDDYLKNCQNIAEIRERVLSAAYIPPGVFFEVLYFVTIVSDELCQCSGTRSLYLRHREGAQKRLFSVLAPIVGEENLSDVDASLAERSTQYGTDRVRAAVVLSTFVDGQMPTPSTVFAKAALGYVVLSHFETFGRMIFYEPRRLRSAAATCPKCGGRFSVRPSRALGSVRCRACQVLFEITQLKAPLKRWF